MSTEKSEELGEDQEKSKASSQAPERSVRRWLWRYTWRLTPLAFRRWLTWRKVDRLHAELKAQGYDLSESDRHLAFTVRMAVRRVPKWVRWGA